MDYIYRLITNASSYETGIANGLLFFFILMPATLYCFRGRTLGSLTPVMRFYLGSMVVWHLFFIRAMGVTRTEHMVMYSLTACFMLVGNWWLLALVFSVNALVITPIYFVLMDRSLASPLMVDVINL